MVVKLPARSTAIYICRKVGGYRLSEIADVMGGMTYTGISKSVCRSEQNKILLKDIGIITRRLLRKQKNRASHWVMSRFDPVNVKI